jgi:hypothetical protein
VRKEETINNLIECLKKQKEKNQLVRQFHGWRERVQDSDMFETPQFKFAKKVHQKNICRKIWVAWSKFTQKAWQKKLEARLEAKTIEKLETMEKECDARMGSLQETLSDARQEVEHLNSERESREDRMKAALMRGVCALNLETMNVFCNSNSAKSCSSADSSLYNGINSNEPRNNATSSKDKNFLNDSSCADRGEMQSSTPVLVLPVPTQKPATSLLECIVNDIDASNGRLSSNSSFSISSHRPVNTVRSSASQNRRSCGINPIGARGRGAQIKSIPHNTIVIERHVDHDSNQLSSRTTFERGGNVLR